MGHIAVFLPSLRGGGAERMMVILANEFANHGHQVDLLLAKKKGPYERLVGGAVNCIDFKRGRVLLSLIPLIKYLKKNKPDVLLSAMNHTNIVSVWARILSRSNTKCVVSVRNAMKGKKGITKRLNRILFYGLIKLSYPYSHAITTVSNGVSNEVAILLPGHKEKIHTVYNPVVGPELKEQIKEPLRHPWLTSDNIPVIISVGRLTFQKNFDSLIHSFCRVRKEIDAKLIIFGEGEMREELEKLVNKLRLEEHVHLPGFVNNPFSYIKKASLFVLSSRWEGLPGVLIQAMACGTPVLSTDCPHGPAEILENGKWGKLVPVGDPDKMSREIINSLQQTKHPDVTRRANYFSVDKAVDNYLRIMKLNT